MKVLIIGLGSIATKHINALRQLNKSVEIYALRTSKNSNKSEGVRDLFSYEEINFKPDFILISNPTIQHKETILKALQFSVPLFIEKPSLASMEGADDLVKAIGDKNIITYVACNLRFHAGVLFVKDFLNKNEKAINEINIYCGSHLPDWRPGRNFREIYSANAEQGGGVHLDLIHEIDYLYWLFGKPVAVNSVKSSRSSLKIPAIDYANYCFEYPSFSAGLIVNYYRKDPKRIFEIVLEDDTLTLDLIKCTVVNSKGELLFSSEEKIIHTYIPQMEYFLKCIHAKQKTMNTFEDSVEVLKMCLDETEK